MHEIFCLMAGFSATNGLVARREKRFNGVYAAYNNNKYISLILCNAPPVRDV